jgi:alpha-glucosidase
MWHITLSSYGSHPVYLEHRWVPSTNSFQSHGVFLSRCAPPLLLLFAISLTVLPSAAGSDVFLASPPSSNQTLIQYRIIGGTLDLYFFSGPDPKSVIEQYGQVVGLPTRPPNWGFGFHLCRWGYASLSETKEQVDAMRAANIPLEGSFRFRNPPKMASSAGLACADQSARLAQ